MDPHPGRGAGQGRGHVDFGGSSFAQLLTIKNQPAIPTNTADENNPARIQAIANTAAFHFAFIEQGGSSLYTTLLQQVSSVEVLRIVASIGGTEVDHFSLWHDKVLTAVAPPNNVTDPVTGLAFPDLSSNTDVKSTTARAGRTHDERPARQREPTPCSRISFNPLTY